MILHSNTFGQGKAFVILHGFLGMSDNWKTLGKQFSETPFEVHLVDQRNHGRSFHSDDFNYDLMANDLKVYCETHNLSDIVLLGHSMGGKTGMLFAAKYPEFVSHLIVADIAPRFYPVHHETILHGLSVLESSHLKSRREADQLLSEFIPELGIRLFLLKNLYWVKQGELGLRLNLSTLKENVSEVGEALPGHLVFDKETLFLRGDRSEYISDQDINLIQQHFPNSDLQTIPDSGHWLHAENPLAFYDAVMNFVSS